MERLRVLVRQRPRAVVHARPSRRHSDRHDRLGCPPDIISLPWFWSSAREGIIAVFDACAAEPGCANRYPDLQETFTQLVRSLEADPVGAGVRPPQGGAPVRVVLDGGTLVNVLVGNVVKHPDVPAAIHELAQGNPQRFLE